MQTTTQHELTIITTILFLLCNYCNATFVEMQQNKSFWDIVKRHPASYSRNVHMHSRHGHYISINEAGEVKAVFDSKSPDSKCISFLTLLPSDQYDKGDGGRVYLLSLIFYV